MASAGLIAAHKSKSRVDKQRKYAVVTLTDCRSVLDPTLSNHHFGKPSFRSLFTCLLECVPTYRHVINIISPWYFDKKTRIEKTTGKVHFTCTNARFLFFYFTELYIIIRQSLISLHIRSYKISYMAYLLIVVRF